jgi:hypothetical protein
MDRLGRALGYGLHGETARTGEANDDLIAPNNNQGNMGRADDGDEFLVTNDDNNEGWSLAGDATQRTPQDQRPTVVNQAALPPAPNMNQGRQLEPPAPGEQQQPQMAVPVTTQEYSGLGLALSRMGHTMYEPRTLEAELSLQGGTMEGNTNALARFKDFAVNYGQLRVYAAMVGDQKTITMIHTLGTFYLLKHATNAYQGKVVRFIGD